jgi:flagellar motor protein MotB
MIASGKDTDLGKILLTNDPNGIFVIKFKSRQKNAAKMAELGAGGRGKKGGFGSAGNSDGMWTKKKLEDPIPVAVVVDAKEGEEGATLAVDGGGGQKTDEEKAAATAAVAEAKKAAAIAAADAKKAAGEAKKAAALAKKDAAENDVVLAEDEEAGEPEGEVDVGPLHLSFRISAMERRMQNNGSVDVSSSSSASSSSTPLNAAPKRGDLVCFDHSSKGLTVTRVTVITPNVAKTVQGVVLTITDDVVVMSTSGEASSKLEFSLREVVGCAPEVLRVGDVVEGIIWKNKVCGVARTKDLHLNAKLAAAAAAGGGTGEKKERKKLNLVVKEELKGMGAAIMAQSSMAVGPDGTNGFVEGWTERKSKHGFFVAEEKVAN